MSQPTYARWLPDSPINAPSSRLSGKDLAAGERFRALCQELGPMRKPLLAVLLHEVSAAAWAETEGLRRDDGAAVFKAALRALTVAYAREAAGGAA